LASKLKWLLLACFAERLEGDWRIWKDTSKVKSKIGMHIELKPSNLFPASTQKRYNSNKSNIPAMSGAKLSCLPVQWIAFYLVVVFRQLWDLLTRIIRVIRANINNLIGSAEDPEKIPGTNCHRYAGRFGSTGGRLWLMINQNAPERQAGTSSPVHSRWMV